MSEQYPPSGDAGGQEDDTPDLLRKPTSSSAGEQPQAWPGYEAPSSAEHEPTQDPAGDGPQQPFAPYGSPASAPYPYPTGVYALPHAGANTAMGLGIASLVSAVLVPVCCVSIIAVPTGPFAIYLGWRARRDLTAHPGAYSNPGAATAGIVCGAIGTILGILMVLAVFLFFGFVIAVGTE